MKSAYTKSIVRITSCLNNRPEFGSGFIIRYSKGSTYVVTCAHVIRDIGGSSKVRIGENHDEVEVVATGSSSFDVAVLKVKKQFEECVPLSVCLSCEEGERFVICGWRQFAGQFVTTTSVYGRLTLLGDTEEKNHRAETYSFEVENPDKNLLDDGCSGAPVINEKNGCVAGIVLQKIDQGRKGICISINAVTKICPELYSLNDESELKLRTMKISELLVSKRKIDEALRNEIKQIKVLRSRLDRQ